MTLAGPSLAVGLIAGLLLALFLDQMVQLPSLKSQAGVSEGSTSAATLFSLIVSSAAMLRNSLQIAGRAVGLPGYKSFTASRAATASIVQHQQQHTVTRFSTPTYPSTSSKSFSTTSSTMADQKSFLQAIKDRRTIYQLNNKAPISDKEIVAIVKDAVLHVPSSFNSQSARLVVLLKAEHEKFWDSVLEVLKPIVPAEQFGSTEGKVKGFRAAYGTILFFEDPKPVQDLQNAFPLYAHHFPDWSEHTSAMHQYALWVALEAEGFGANLQHYNPIIDQKVQEHWNVPLNWKLRAQLVFGGKAGEPGEKQFKPVEGERLFVYGADA